MSFPHPPTVLKRLGLKPKKSLGQHFLLYPHQARRLAQALNPPVNAVIVEIGGGLGALSLFLLPRAERLLILEADQVLAAFLQQELFAHQTRVTVLCQDVLTFDFLTFSRQTGAPLQLAGNLPYHLTSPLLVKLMQEKAALAQALLMLQQEVGDRLLAHPGSKDYGILSVLLQYHFALTRLFTLGPANFYPPPQVNSVVLRLVPQQFEPPATDEQLLAHLVKTAFGKRRKTLKNTLVAQASAFGLTREQMLAALTDLDLDPSRRGETLSVEQFVRLSNRLSHQGAVRCFY